MTLLELINLMKKQLRLMIFLPVACAVAVGAYAFLGMPDTYLATTSLYVLTVQSDSNSNLSTDLTASQLVANDVTSLLNSSRVQKQVAEELGLKDLFAARDSAQRQECNRSGSRKLPAGEGATVLDAAVY